MEDPSSNQPSFSTDPMIVVTCLVYSYELICLDCVLKESRMDSLHYILIEFLVTGKSGKKDFSTAILERKKSANCLVVDEAINDDNSVVAMHLATMEKLQFFRGDTMLKSQKSPKKCI
ncbi:hypothetical protein Peur_028031 [Populus x canadensis]